VSQRSESFVCAVVPQWEVIENFYNPERRHSAIGYATPVDERLTRAPIAA
jgi:transposase InsO family protein